MSKSPRDYGEDFVKSIFSPVVPGDTVHIITLTVRHEPKKCSTGFEVVKTPI
jgi:hypothetical protein